MNCGINTKKLWRLIKDLEGGQWGEKNIHPHRRVLDLFQLLPTPKLVSAPIVLTHNIYFSNRCHHIIIMASHPHDEPQQQAPPDTLNDHENNSDDEVESLSPQQQTAAVKQIMAQCVAKQSADKYAGQNAGFAMFCYNSDELHDVLLEPWFIEGIDEIERTYDKKKYAKECCLKSSAEDDNCPFILSNLTFAQFSHYLSIKTRSRGKNQGQAMTLSNASYEQCQSALKHLFRMSKYDMGVSFLEQLKQFTKGIRRTVADKKKEEGDCLIVGKKKMDFKVYQ
jgi:hypothetical protein